jgi:hypothetical protein
MGGSFSRSGSDEKTAVAQPLTKYRPGEEGVIKRKDNPVSKIEKSLPKKKKGESAHSRKHGSSGKRLRIAGFRSGPTSGCNSPHPIVWMSGPPVKRLILISTGGLQVIPADNYKSDHVHVMPLVPQVVAILKDIPKPTTGPYLLSSTGGRVPIQGIAKFYQTRLQARILAHTGAKFSKPPDHSNNSTHVATMLAEQLGDEGDKLIKRVLGHSDRSVTSIYNRYGYVREMRRILENWATALTTDTVDAS